MSLNKPQLRVALTALFDNTISSTGNADDAREQFVNDLSDAIEHYVKGATINYLNGLVSGSGSVTGVFNGSLS